MHLFQSKEVKLYIIDMKGTHMAAVLLSGEFEWERFTEASDSMHCMTYFVWQSIANMQLAAKTKAYLLTTFFKGEKYVEWI